MKLTPALAALAVVSLAAAPGCAQEETDSAQGETGQQQAAAPEAAADGAAEPALDAPDSAWRALDPENTIYLEVAKAAASAQALLDDPETQTIVIELAPDLAPNHVARIKELAREGFYDGRVFHRVIPGFMAQAGGLPSNPQGGESGRPDMAAEFTARIGPDAPIAKAQDARRRDPRSGNSPVTEAGFLNGFPVGYQPAAQATVSADGKRDIWMLHCPGTVASARTSNPNSANFQFYIATGEPSWLDAAYTAWGRVRAGQNAVVNITPGEPPQRPDRIERMRVAADVPESERLNIEVLRTDSDAFAQLVTQARDTVGGDANACAINVPTRIAD